ncbi:MAG: hypothetical protein WKH68_12165 [Candidatus Limnocylindria bacterium]
MDSYMGTSSVTEAEKRIRQRVGRCTGFDDGPPRVTAYGPTQDRVLVIEHMAGNRRCEVVRLVAEPDKQRTKVVRYEWVNRDQEQACHESR